jgi:hypothetical protein
MVRAIGIDLGIRSGAVVDVGFHMINDMPKIYSLKTLWTGERKRGKTARTNRGQLDPAGLAQIGQDILAGITDLNEVVVGIDWGLHEAYWGSRKPALQKAFLAGYLYRRLLEYGALPLFIPPMEVRKFLGLKQGAEKSAVWDAFLPFCSMTAITEPRNEHEIDAAILAVLGHVAWVGGASLGSSA